jgi:hypothetical protein
VTRDSAIHKCSGSHDIISIDQNHSDLVKFADGDSDYLCILHFLQQIISTARHSSLRPRDRPQHQKQHIPFVQGGKASQHEISGAISDNILSLFDANNTYRNNANLTD